MDNALSILRASIFKNYLILGAICLGLYALAGLLILSDQEFQATHRLFAATAIILVLLASYFLIYAYSRRKRQESLLHVLEHEPEKVIWLYRYIVENRPYGIQFFRMCIMYFHTLNGDRIGIMIAPSQAEYLESILRDILLHARFGYSGNRAFLFKTDPRLLIKD